MLMKKCRHGEALTSTPVKHFNKQKLLDHFNTMINKPGQKRGPVLIAQWKKYVSIIEDL